MGLPLKTNKSKTIKKVRHFFQDDDEFPRIVRLAGPDKELKSPHIDITGVRGSGAGNATENRYLMHAHYQTARDIVDFAIRSMPEVQQTIMFYKYVQPIPVWQVANKVGLEKSAFNELDKKACLDFADYLQGIADDCEATDEFGLDLHVYDLEPEAERKLTGS